MATWFATAALDAELNHIKTSATSIRLLDTYSPGDNFATVSSNTIGTASITGTDFSGPTASGNNRVLTFSGKDGTATGNSSVGALHIAITSGSDVLAVTDETSDQPITNGNPIVFPSFTMTANQPTQV